ncbi:neuropeptide receptor npr-1-like [Amphiura filiformis]|uniref:neuropeptide receptor npr-1-like n=1 Tax=Amphiura filiformis TaxID=82378 RepID=UPI003B220F7A
MSEESLPLFSYDILNIVFNSLLFLVGIPGNCLIIRVYVVKKNNSSARIFIIGLAINDLLLCLIRPLHIFDNLPIANELADVSAFYCKMRCQFMLLFISVFITACIALDRYYAVCRPFDGVITANKAKYAIAVCIILPVLVRGPWIFCNGLVRESPTGASGKDFNCIVIASDEYYYSSLFLCYSAVVGSQIIATVFCVKIIFTLRSQRSKIRPVFNSAIEPSTVSSSVAQPSASVNATGITNNSQRDVGEQGAGETSVIQSRPKDAYSKTTKMLLLTTICFILFWFPCGIFYLIPPDIINKDNFKDSPGLAAIIRFLSEDFFLINIVINPLLYSLVNKRFRDESKDVIRKVFCRDSNFP